LAASNEHGGATVDDAVGHGWFRAAIERQLAWSPVEPVDFGDGGREQFRLIARADLRGGGEDEPARAAARSRPSASWTT
jgi:hypothetical protein